MENSQALNVNETTEKTTPNKIPQLKEEVLNAEEISERIKNRSLSSYFSSGEGLKKTLTIFGQSEEEIEKEFKNYKAQKVFNKLDYLIIDNSLPKSTFKKECETAVKYSFKSITVLPNLVSLAKSYVNNAVKVYALISYPYGEDYSQVKLKSISQALNQKADGITLPVSVSKIKSVAYKQILADFKKFVGKARKKDVNVLLNVSKLSPTEIQSTVTLLSQIKGVTSIMPYETIRDKTFDITAVKDIIKTLNGKVNVNVFSKISTAEDAVSVLSLGANGITSEKCVNIVTDAINKLNF